jgi:phosphohistidine swiveling domain-containing protein
MPFNLDDQRAVDPLIAGVKAARLAAARRAGLPVLDGWVIGSPEGMASIAAGQAAVDAGRPGYARTAAREADDGAALVQAARLATGLGPTLIVRSSSRLDDDGRWAGAFATYGDVGPEELEIAIRGCWASAFTPAALDRFERDGRRPVDAGLAVLIQPQVRPDAGGWAVRRGSGVEIALVEGPPGPLFGGWLAGSRIAVDARGAVSGSLEIISADAACEIAGLLDRAYIEVGADRIEWAIVGKAPVLLQVNAGATPIAERPPLIVNGPIAEPYRRLAWRLLDRRGSLFEWLVAPWVVSAPAEPAVIRWTGDLIDAWRAAVVDAEALAQFAAEAVDLDRATLLDHLMRADPNIAARLARISPDPERIGRLLGAIDAVAASLVLRGLLPTPAAIWWQSEAWVERAVAGAAAAPASRPYANRFADLSFAVVSGAGEVIAGAGASPGRSVARAFHIGSPDASTGVAPGSILVVDTPNPAYGPLLWSAAGLVARTGGPAAHLCEIARSLRVPAVVGAVGLDVGALAGRPALAIDGWSGDVWLAPSDESRWPDT